MTTNQKVVLSILIILIAALVSSCQSAGAAAADGVWPTVEATHTIVPTGVLATPTPFATMLPAPDFDAWVIGEEVTDEQKMYLNKVLEFVWYSYFSPKTRPDCEIIQTVFTADNPWTGTADQYCQQMKTQNYYVMYEILPNHRVNYYAYPDSPNNVKFVVRVSTEGAWQARARYYDDGKQRGFLRFMETVIDFHFSIEDGKLLIALIDQFQRDPDGKIYLYNEAGMLVPAP